MNGSTVMAALVVEAYKTTAAPAVRTTTVLIIGGIALVAGALTLAARSGNEQVLAKLGPFASEEGWELLTATVAQVTAAGGLLGFGVVVSWIIGREYADGTITGLFALPVGRPAIAFAKLTVYLLWTMIVALVLTACVGAVGLVLLLGPLDAAVLGALGRQFGLTVLSGLIAVPAAWASTLGRGLLPGLASTVGIIVVAQVMVVAGSGAWFPFAAPALWALEPDKVSALQLALVAIIPAVFGSLTIWAWARLQLDR